jgi:hypothetical protein
MRGEVMTFDPKEARALAAHFKNDQPVTQDMQSTMIAEEMQLAADALTAALDEIERLRRSLEEIGSEDRTYLNDAGNSRRRKEVARAALKGSDQ